MEIHLSGSFLQNFLKLILKVHIHSITVILQTSYMYVAVLQEKFCSYIL